MVQQKIKVLHIIKSLGRGGAEMLLPETLKVHDKSRFEFHYGYFLPWKNQMVSAIESAGGTVLRWTANNNFQILTKSATIQKYILANSIDLVHCHLPWAGFVGRIIHKTSGIPVIYTEHNKQERYHRITFWLNKLTFNWQNQVLAVSEDVSNSIKKNINPKVPVATLLNGVNTKSFMRDSMAGNRVRHELGIPSEALVVGTVAVFRFQKRLVEWVRVMHTVCQNDPLIFGIIVGDGPLKRDIQREVAAAGLSDRVFLVGLKEDVKPWLSAMDIYMMSSVFEGLPIALLEAMSTGCAIATTDAGGIKELVRDEVDGLSVNVDNWQSLADCLGRLRDPNLRQSLAIAARNRVVQSFSLKAMVGQLESVYSEIATLHR